MTSMGRFHRESPAVKKFKQSPMYQRIIVLSDESASAMANFNDNPQLTLIFLAKLYQLYVDFADQISQQKYDASVADEADTSFMKLNSLIATTLEFNHSAQFPQFDSEQKMLISTSSDNDTRYWRQADMIELLYNRLFTELLNQSPGDVNKIDQVADTKQIKLDKSSN